MVDAPNIYSMAEERASHFAVVPGGESVSLIERAGAFYGYDDLCTAQQLGALPARTVPQRRVSFASLRIQFFTLSTALASVSLLAWTIALSRKSQARRATWKRRDPPAAIPQVAEKGLTGK